MPLMTRETLLSWEFWVYNVASAFIGGGATCVAAMVIAPETFNLRDLQKLFELALASGLINVAFYLKKSPLPKLKFNGVNGASDTTTTTNGTPS